MILNRVGGVFCPRISRHLYSFGNRGCRGMACRGLGNDPKIIVGRGVGESGSGVNPNFKQSFDQFYFLGFILTSPHVLKAKL